MGEISTSGMFCFLCLPTGSPDYKRHLHFYLCPSNVFHWTSLEVENNGIACLIQNTVHKERIPSQSAQVKRNGPTIQLQHLDGNNDQHSLCFFLNQESKNVCCWWQAATFPRAFYSSGELLMLMHYKGSKKKNSSHICICFISRPCGSYCSNWKQ